MTFPGAIADALPSDNEMRTGVVTAINPLTVALEGGTVVSPGRLGMYGPNLGDNVMLLRQDATWLVMGDVLGNASTVPGAGITDMRQAIATGGLNATVTATVLPGASLTFTTQRPGARYHAFYTVDWSQIGATATTAVGEIFLNGTAAVVGAPQNIFQGTTTVAPTGLRFPGAQNFMGTLGVAATYSLDLRIRRIGGADNMVTANASHSSLSLYVYE